MAKRVEVLFGVHRAPGTGDWRQPIGIDDLLGRPAPPSGAEPGLWPGHGAARPDRRPHRVGKSTPMHAIHHQLAALVQPRRDRPLPDRLQEGGREFKQGLRDLQPAPRERSSMIESEREFGISVLQRIDAELLEDPRRRSVSARRRKTSMATATPRARPAPNPAGRRRVPGVLRRGRQGRRSRIFVDRLVHRVELRHPHRTGLAEPGRRVHAGPEHARPDGRADHRSGSDADSH